MSLATLLAVDENHHVGHPQSHLLCAELAGDVSRVAGKSAAPGRGGRAWSGATVSSTEAPLVTRSSTI